MDPDEVSLLNGAVAGLVDSAGAGELTAALDAFGWLEVLHAHPHAAIHAVFGAQGRSGKWSAALQDVVAANLSDIGIEGAANVVLPRPNDVAPGRWRGEVLEVNGLLLGPRSEASTLVIGAGERRVVTSVITVAPEVVQVELRRGLDPFLGIRAVWGAIEGATVVAEGSLADAWWETAQARARLALCHQIVAALFAMIELAQSHVSERAQFGRLVGTFQAVRHKLVEAYVAATAARCSAEAAWEADDLPLAAATAKVVAGQAVAVAAAHTQQLLAGIGFTSEYPYHHFMKRAVVLERVLGSGTELAPNLGHLLMERGEAPRLVEL